MKTLCVSYYKENFKILPIIKMEVCVGDKYSETISTNFGTTCIQRGPRWLNELGSWIT
jgi:hypothetical protein